MIESTTGGIKFLDGTTQTTASGGSVQSGTHCGSRRVKCQVATRVYDSALVVGGYPRQNATAFSCNGTAIEATCSNWSISSTTCPSGYTGSWSYDGIDDAADYFYYTVVCIKD